MLKLTKIVILALVCFVFLGFGCKKTANNSNQNQQTTTPSIQTVLDLNDSTVLTNTERYQLIVKDNLKYWDKNGQFVALNVKLDGTLYSKSVNQTFIYYSKLKPAINKYYYYTVNFDLEGQYLRALIDKRDYFGILPSTPLAIESKYFKISWLAALKKAEENGGKTFREKHVNDCNITLNLYRGDPNNYTYWFITYAQTNGDDNITMQINASDGAIVNNSANSQQNSLSTEGSNKENLQTQPNSDASDLNQ